MCCKPAFTTSGANTVVMVLHLPVAGVKEASTCCFVAVVTRSSSWPRSAAYTRSAAKSSKAGPMNGIAALEITAPVLSDTPTRVVLGPT